jgi:hypothetical protein
MAGVLAALAAFGGGLLILHPLKRFATEGIVSAFGLASVFVFFALWPWGKRLLPFWITVCLVVVFFLLFKALIVLLIVAGQSR